MLADGCHCLRLPPIQQHDDVEGDDGDDDDGDGDGDDVGDDDDEDDGDDGDRNKQAREPRSYASLKLRPTDRLSD